MKPWAFDESECGCIAVIGIGERGARITQLLSQNLSGTNYRDISFFSIHRQTNNLSDLLSVVKKNDLVFVLADFKDAHDGQFVQILSEKTRESGTFLVGVISCLEKSQNGWDPRLAMETTHLLDVSFQVSAASMPRTKQFSDQKKANRDLDEHAIQHTVATISNLINGHNFIGIDIEDVKVVLRTGSQGWLGVGVAEGLQAGKAAAQLAVKRLQDQGLLLKKVKGACIEVNGSPTMTMEDFEEVCQAIEDLVPESAPVLIGLSHDESHGRNIEVTAMMVS